MKKKNIGFPDSIGPWKQSPVEVEMRIILTKSFISGYYSPVTGEIPQTTSFLKRLFSLAAVQEIQG
jgi:hypothetical protein